MTSLQRKALAGYKTLLTQAKKHLELATDLDGFEGISLKMQMKRHRSDIKMYEKLIARLEGK
jgi:hypothetical protein